MSHAWVTKPGEQHRFQALQAEAQRLYAEVLAIEAAGGPDGCRICGRREPLTDEHTPSKRAGNPMRAIKLSIDDDRTAQTGEVTWTEEFIQGGATTLSLCASCNNSTGRWYNPDYVTLAKHCAPLARPGNAGKLCDVRLTIHPQRVLKQALATIVATSQPGLTERYPHLRAMLLDAEKASSVSSLRLSLFLVASAATRSSGVAVLMSAETGSGRLIAEFSCWPLGWLLTFDSEAFEGATDVSAWSEIGFHEKLDINLKVPCQWAVSPYPGDFSLPKAFNMAGSGVGAPSAEDLTGRSA